MILVRKYVFIFFGLLLVFIWLNHRNKSNEREIKFEQFPAVTEETVSDSSPADAVAREKHLREMIRTNKIVGRFARVQETGKPRIGKLKFSDSDNELADAVAKPVRYFVNNKKCKMPFADPFSREATEIFKPSQPKACSNASDVFQLQYDAQAKHYKLIVNQEVLSKLNPVVSSIDCNYREVTQGTDEKSEHNSK